MLSQCLGARRDTYTVIITYRIIPQRPAGLPFRALALNIFCFLDNDQVGLVPTLLLSPVHTPVYNAEC